MGIIWCSLKTEERQYLLLSARAQIYADRLQVPTPAPVGQKCSQIYADRLQVPTQAPVGFPSAFIRVNFLRSSALERSERKKESNKSVGAVVDCADAGTHTVSSTVWATNKPLAFGKSADLRRPSTGADTGSCRLHIRVHPREFLAFIRA